MLVVIYNCPIFVKVGGWSFTLLPGRHTKFGLNQLKTEKVSPQHILLLGAVSRPFHPVKVVLLKSLPHCPLSPPPAKKSKLSDSVQICWATAHGHYWPGISLERDDMKLILNLWWTDNFNKSHNAHVCPISHNTPLRTKMCAFLFWMLYVVGYGKRAVWDLWNCSIVTEQNQM